MALVFVAACLEASSQHPLADLVGRSFSARVTSVSDGDTFNAIPDGERRPIRIRVFGVDAPERGEPFSTRARSHTRVLVFQKTVTLTGVDVDTYGRLVARVRVGDVDLARDLIGLGLACHYTRYSDDREYFDAEREARRRGLGFWARDAEKPRCVTRVGR